MYRKKQSGFTLLELLVVLAIIGLVSAVVVSSLTIARKRARNANRLQEVNTYTKAAELYFDNARQYPGSLTAYRCLGRSSSETCFGGLAGNDTLLTHFSSVINGAPPKGDEGGLSVYTGYNYACTTSDCSGYSIRYVLEGTNESCASGSLAIDTNFASAYTYCQVMKCHLGTSPVRSAGITSAYVCQ